DLPRVLHPPGALEAPISPATNHPQIELPDVDTQCHAQTLLSAGELLPVHLVDARRTVCFATHGDDLLHVRLRDLNGFALAAYRGIPTSISIATSTGIGAGFGRGVNAARECPAAAFRWTSWRVPRRWTHRPTRPGTAQLVIGPTATTGKSRRWYHGGW